MPVRWQETLRTAGDLAVLGFLVVLAALPVVTAGAAVLAGSAAVRHHLEHDAWPSAGEIRRTFRRAFWPGLAGLAVVAVVAWLITVDVRAVSTGRVPGGLPVAGVLLLLAAGTAGLTGLAVVEAAGPRALLRLAAARPIVPIAAAGVVVLAALLVLLIHPVLTPVLLGYTLFALHVVSASLGRTKQAAPPGGTEDMVPIKRRMGGNLSGAPDHI
jgi:hypothetical protein